MITSVQSSSVITEIMLKMSSNNSRYVMPSATIMTRIEMFCETILHDLNEFGICVIDDFLNNAIADNILNEVLLLYSNGVFKDGQLVNNKLGENSRVIRGDRIVWIDGTEPQCNYIGFLIQTLDSIVMRCNKKSDGGDLGKLRINRRTKAMIACYPGNGTKYVRHIDNPNHDGRCITAIYYLNKDYNRERDGGVLRLFPEMNSGHIADIEPKFDRIIFFWSDRRNPHEVQPSFRIRFAITVWYFDSDEREKALLKFEEESRIFNQTDMDLRPLTRV